MKQVLLYFVIVVGGHNAHAHNDGAAADEHIADLYEQAVANEFYVSSEPAPTTDRWMRLPNDEKFLLNSPFQQASQRLLEKAQEAASRHEHESNCEAQLRPAFFRRRLNKIIGFINWFSIRAFRYRFMGTVPFAIFESLESKFGNFHFFCGIAAVVCLRGSQEVSDFWRAIRSRRPLNRFMTTRLYAEARTNVNQFRYWRSSKTIFKDNLPTTKALFKKSVKTATDSGFQQRVMKSPFWAALTMAKDTENKSEQNKQQCQHDHIFGQPCRHPLSAESFFAQPATSFSLVPYLAAIDPHRSRDDRIFALNEQLAFLELELWLAEEAIEDINSFDMKPSVPLIRALGREGRALNEYTRIMSLIADADVVTPELQRTAQAVVELFIPQLRTFHSDLVNYLKLLKQGLVPFRTDESRRLFSAPKEVYKALFKI